MQGLATVLLCLVAGDVLRHLGGVPVSGPVIGMALMVALLSARGGASPSIEQTCGVFLRWLPLLFVPAGVGVIQYLGVLRHELAAIATALVVSTALAMAAAGLAMQAMMRWRAAQQRRAAPAQGEPERC